WPWGDFWNNFATAQPNPALGVVVPIYICPADTRSLTAYYSAGDQMTVAFTSYLGNTGSDDTTANRYNGVLFWQGKIRLTSIRAGTSNTILAGERPPSTDLEYGWWFAGAGYTRGIGDVVLSANNIRYTQAMGCPSNYAIFQNGDVNNGCDQCHYW